MAECFTGELLSETLARRGALPVEEALDLCLQAAAGLEAAHNLRWVHGTLSPDTILLTQTVGGRPLVKLISFTQGRAPGDIWAPSHGFSGGRCESRRCQP